MILSRRERYITIATTVCIGLWLLDWVAIEPLTEHRNDLDSQIAIARNEVGERASLLSRRPWYTRQWNDFKSVLPSDAATAGTQGVDIINKLATESRLNLTNLKPDTKDEVVKLPGSPGQSSSSPNKDEPQLHRVTIQASGSGNMKEIRDFLFKCQTAKIPLHIVNLQLSSRKMDGNDDLNVSITFSSLFLPAEKPKSEVVSVSKEVW